MLYAILKHINNNYLSLRLNACLPFPACSFYQNFVAICSHAICAFFWCKFSFSGIWELFMARLFAKFEIQTKREGQIYAALHVQLSDLVASTVLILSTNVSASKFIHIYFFRSFLKTINNPNCMCTVLLALQLLKST